MKRTFQYLLILITILVIVPTSLAQPPAPTNLSATMSSAGVIGVKLTWNFSTPAVSMMNFNIYRKEGSLNDTNSFVLKYTNVRSLHFHDINVQLNHTYSYYVTALNNSGESNPSNMVQITVALPVANVGKICGVVYNDSTNAPISNAQVKIFGANSTMGKTVFTNDNGFFITPIPAGSYYIFTNAMGYLPEYYDNVSTISEATLVTVSANDSLFFTIGLSPRHPVPSINSTVKGKVTDDLNQPLRARISAFKLRNNSLHTPMYSTMTDNEGNYTLLARNGDTIIVYAAPLNNEFLPEYFDNKRTFNEADRIFVNGNIENINFILERRPVFANGISGSVKDSLNNPVESMVFALRKMNVTPVTSRRYVTLTDSLTGEYQFNNMQPGMYILLAKPKANYLPTFFRYDGMPTMNWRFADSVVVDESGIINNINFIVRPMPDSGLGIVSGQIKDNNDNIINGALIYVIDENNNFVSYAFSDVNGNYRIEGLYQNDYKIICDLMGYNLSQQTISIDYQSIYQLNVGFVITPEGSLTSVKENIKPVSFKVEQNYPNPFNPATYINYSIPSDEFVTIKIFNIIGKEIATLVNSYQKAGNYSVEFNASDLSSGIYFYTISAGSYRTTKKMILSK